MRELTLNGEAEIPSQGQLRRDVYVLTTSPTGRARPLGAVVKTHTCLSVYISKRAPMLEVAVQAALVAAPAVHTGYSNGMGAAEGGWALSAESGRLTFNQKAAAASRRFRCEGGAPGQRAPLRSHGMLPDREGGSVRFGLLLCRQPEISLLGW